MIRKYQVKNGISTILLAGAPGVGKTEFLDTIINSENFIIINIDKYRKHFSGYNGKNADLYQDCSSRVARGLKGSIEKQDKLFNSTKRNKKIFEKAKDLATF